MMTRLFIVTTLTLLMSISPRVFVMVTVVLGSVLFSRLQYLLGINDFEGNMLRNIATNCAGVLLVVLGALTGRRLYIPRPLRPYAVLVVIAATGILYAINTTEAVRFVSILTIPLLVFLVARLHFQAKDFLWTFHALVAVGVVQLFAGAMEYFLVPGERVRGLHDVPAVYGWSLSIILMVASYLAAKESRRNGPVLLFTGAAAFVIVLTGSRMALVLFPLALWYLVLELPLRRLAVFSSVLVAMGVAVWALSLQIEQGTARVGVEVSSSDVEFVGEAGGTVAWRFLLWERLLYAWTERPLFGYGPGADYAVSLAGGLTEDLNYSETSPLNTHNEYIKLLFNHGIVGLALFLLFVFRLLRLPHGETGGGDRSLRRLIRFLGISWLVFSLSDNGLSYHGQTSIVFLACAFLWSTTADECPSGSVNSGKRPSVSLPSS